MHIMDVHGKCLGKSNIEPIRYENEGHCLSWYINGLTNTLSMHSMSGDICTLVSVTGVQMLQYIVL